MNLATLGSTTNVYIFSKTEHSIKDSQESVQKSPVERFDPRKVLN